MNDKEKRRDEQVEIQKLLKSAKKGNHTAFYQLINHHKEQLYRVAYAYFKNEQESLEAIQEVTFRAFKNIKKVKKHAYFTTWLTRIMINYCIDELKHKMKVTLNESDLQYIGVTEEKDEKIHMETFIIMLEPKLQEVIILKYFQDMTINQIALHLGHPSGTIKTWLYKALGILKNKMGEEGEYYV